MMPREPRISVIVPSYNSRRTIGTCLQSLFKQTCDQSFEVIVVDSSSDGTDQGIAEIFPDAKLIHLQEKTIPGTARNIGAQQARGEILAFTDSDCIPASDWLQTICENISSGYGIVGGSVENGRPESMISRAEYYIEFREFSTSSPKREIRFLPSCNFAIRKSVFDAVNGFPEVRASEDTFFAHNLTEQGHKILFDPEVRIKHLNRNQWKPYLQNQFVIGKYAAVVRKLLPMPGAFFVRVPYAFPILPVVRTLRTLQFIFQNSFKHAVQQLLDFLLIYPIFFVGSMVWSYGFYCGITRESGNAQNDKD